MVGLGLSAAQPHLNVVNRPQAVEVVVSDGLGSGVEVRPGLIITARHVVHGNDTVRIVREDGTEIFGAKVLWEDEARDLAAVSIPTEWSGGAHRLACNYTGTVGDRVEAIGNPLGFRFIHTWGHVAGTQASIEQNRLNDRGADVLKTWKQVFMADLSIAPGNSGGPLFNERGEVVGLTNGVVVVSLSMMSGTFAGLTYVVPSKAICEAIAEHAPKQPVVADNGLDIAAIAGAVQ